MRPRKLLLQLTQPIEQRACLVNAATQHNMVEESLIARLCNGETLGLKVFEEFTTSNNLLVDQVSRLLRIDMLHKIELKQEDKENLPWTLTTLGKPLKKRFVPQLSEMKNFPRRT